MYLGWFDDEKKKKTGAKILEALARYKAKHGEHPNVCAVNTVDFQNLLREIGEHEYVKSGLLGEETIEYLTYNNLSVEVSAVTYVRPNHFWVGRKEVEVAA